MPDKYQERSVYTYSKTLFPFSTKIYPFHEFIVHLDEIFVRVAPCPGNITDIEGHKSQIGPLQQPTSCISFHAENAKKLLQRIGKCVGGTIFFAEDQEQQDELTAFSRAISLLSAFLEASLVMSLTRDAYLQRAKTLKKSLDQYHVFQNPHVP